MASLVRAVGKMLTAQLSVPAFADETAHRHMTFPCFEVEQLGGDEVAKGPGKKVIYNADAKPKPIFFEKGMKGEIEIQITALAKTTADGSSEKLCVKLINQVRALFETIIYDESTQYHFVDPVDDTDMGVIRIVLRQEGGARPNLRTEPIVHEATLRMTLHTNRKVRWAVPRTIEHPKNRYPEDAYA